MAASHLRCCNRVEIRSFVSSSRGNSGIGLATARLFIAEGEQVAITGRDQKTLDGAIAEFGSSARGYRDDATIAEDPKRLFAALAKDFTERRRFPSFL